MILLLTLPLATAALTVPSLWIAAAAWKNRLWTLPGRLHYSLVALFTGFLHYWNLLGFRF